MESQYFPVGKIHIIKLQISDLLIWACLIRDLVVEWEFY